MMRIHVLLLSLLLTTAAYSKLVEYKGINRFSGSSTVIPKGETWFLNPGTEFVFPQGGKLIVEGRIVAQGTEISQITFRGRKNKTWSGIWFKGDNSPLEFTADQSQFWKIPIDVNIISSSVLKSVVVPGMPLLAVTNSTLLLKDVRNEKSEFSALLLSRNSEIYSIGSSINCGSSGDGVVAEGSKIYLQNNSSQKSCNRVVSAKNSVVGVQDGYYSYRGVFAAIKASTLYLSGGTFAGGDRVITSGNSKVEVVASKFVEQSKEPISLNDRTHLYMGSVKVDANNTMCPILLELEGWVQLKDNHFKNDCASTWFDLGKFFTGKIPLWFSQWLGTQTTLPYNNEALAKFYPNFVNQYFNNYQANDLQNIKQASRLDGLALRAWGEVSHSGEFIISRKSGTFKFVYEFDSFFPKQIPLNTISGGVEYPVIDVAPSEGMRAFSDVTNKLKFLGIDN